MLHTRLVHHTSLDIHVASHSSSCSDIVVHASHTPCWLPVFHIPYERKFHGINVYIYLHGAGVTNKNLVWVIERLGTVFITSRVHGAVTPTVPPLPRCAAVVATGASLTRARVSYPHLCRCASTSLARRHARGGGMRTAPARCHSLAAAAQVHVSRQRRDATRDAGRCCGDCYHTGAIQLPPAMKRAVVTPSLLLRRTTRCALSMRTTAPSSPASTCACATISATEPLASGTFPFE